MVKQPDPPPTLRPATRVRKAARLVLSGRLEDTWRRHPAARAGEPEAGIHQMRVAAKRLREAMRVFRPAYAAEPFAEGLALVDELNDHLGRVRDADVLVAALRRYRDDAGAGLVDALVDQITAGRAVDQARLNGELDELLAAGFDRQLRAIIWTGRRERDDPTSRQTIRTFACAAIGRRIAPVVKRLSQVAGEHDAEGLHRARVANKKLRYAIEPFLDLYGRRLRDAFGRVTELHETLGDLHDLDVLAERIRAFGASLGAEDDAEALAHTVAARRSKVYQRVLTFCENGATSAFGRQIADAID